MTELSPAGLKSLQEGALAVLAAVDSSAALEVWRVAYIGRKGKLTLLLRELKDVPAAERKTVGQVANDARVALQAAYATAQEKFGAVTVERAAKKKSGQAVTYLSGLPQAGHLHPLTLTMRRIQAIFLELGFQHVDGPEVEDPRYNFDLLNISLQHPARAETDTFYIQNGNILRTQVSPIQIRGVEDNQLVPPFKMFYFGRTFRAERTDATHETTFHQFEFMVVGANPTLAQLKGIIETFYSKFFGKPTTIRFRPGFFPFVEPGLEVDLHCVFCGGEGCRVCKYSGWIEMAGAGMVHPNVLRAINVDSMQYQGFALGGAVDRLAMLLYGIDDIRLFWSGDIRFLRQFS